MSELLSNTDSNSQSSLSNQGTNRAHLESNFVYEQLSNWLKKENIHLENEMFRAVLDSSKKLVDNYLSTGKVTLRTACRDSFYFHTFTAPDGIHTDVKQVQKYVSDFWKVLKPILARKDSH